MIRRGRDEGWLVNRISLLPTWAAFHGVKFNGVKIAHTDEDRGSGVVATRDLDGDNAEPLLFVPKELIISRANVKLWAKSNHELREVLEAIGEFGRTTRGAVLTLLLMQAYAHYPKKGYGENLIKDPIAEYITYLPDELLPTFWTEYDMKLFEGTTLVPAVRAKLSSLLREFEQFKAATQSISWCEKYWWDETAGVVTFDDWKRVDAMYRSRALEFPGAGDCMMPLIDMANHASGDATDAVYETDEDGNGLLLLRKGKTVAQGSEITITYGDDKGACEYVFSYAFLDENMTSAKVMFLDIDIPDDDPLRPAKLFVSTAAPGFRIFDDGDGVKWESDFIWLAVVNEEDGLEFKVKMTVDGEREIQCIWRECELGDTSMLRGLLEEDPSWDVLQLRATVLVQNRVQAQLEEIRGNRVVSQGPAATYNRLAWMTSRRLPEMERKMLEHVALTLDEQKTKLLKSKTVMQYLGMSGSDKADEEEELDFT
ncbi:hypothetical protein GQ44DRAFT_619034 [Phaeosphaeriaceae sp. PMI808]|nr:hypothetical protein GQ44DRAFT_619034 [Phaeosphaeriaceae sp. PMI808]